MITLGARSALPTFRAPVSRPGADPRPETWGVVSADGLWRFDRIDDEGTPWVATFLPTGQSDETFGTLAAARREAGPAGRLLDQFRRETFTLAYVSADPAERLAGQRYVALHLRHLGQTEADYRCECGGILAIASQDGTKLAHLDACADCWTDGSGYVDGADGLGCRVGHRFCGTPAPVECGHNGDDRLHALCGELARPNAGEGCGRGLSVDCCRACCHGE
jgi:hypothetical protein